MRKFTSTVIISSYLPTMGIEDTLSVDLVLHAMS